MLTPTTVRLLLYVTPAADLYAAVNCFCWLRPYHRFHCNHHCRLANCWMTAHTLRIITISVRF